MLTRPQALKETLALLDQFPAVGILGPRQVGKTTLAGMVAKKTRCPVHWFDLERPADLRRLGDSGLALEQLKGLVVLDEIQHRPDLFGHLRYLCDRPGRPARFLITGSADPDLLRQSSESLAGRVAYMNLDGFSLSETGPTHTKRLWLRGGFPRSFLAKNNAESLQWRGRFVETFLTRDLRDFAPGTEPVQMRRFWSMLAHYHGQILNASELGRAFGVSYHWVRRWMDRLTQTFMVHQLQPWHENLKKRQVKAPKIYLRDTGLLHLLLGIHNDLSLQGHPKVGASWEGFALGEILRRLNPATDQSFFWATHSGAELDLLIIRGQHRYGVEFKRNSAPSLTPSMRTAKKDLKLQKLWVIHAGDESFPLAKDIEALPLDQVQNILKKL